jgi:hypothetical protein
MLAKPQQEQQHLALRLRFAHPVLAALGVEQGTFHYATLPLALYSLSYEFFSSGIDPPFR